MNNSNEHNNENNYEISNTIIKIKGDQYWIGDKAKIFRKDLIGGACTHQGNFNDVFFYDYHRDTKTKDIKQKYLNYFTCFSKSTLFNTTNYHFAIEKKNVARKAISDYLNEFVDYSASENIINYIEDYCSKTPNDCDTWNLFIDNMLHGYEMQAWKPPEATPDQLSDVELVDHNVIIGNLFFNSLFYPSAVQIIKEIVPSKYVQEIYNAFVRNIEHHGYSIYDYTNKENILVTLFDECQNYVFNCVLSDGKFSVDENCNARDFKQNPGYRYYLCSKNDYKKYIEKILLFISNWSLVLSSYMSVCIFGSISLTVCY